MPNNNLLDISFSFASSRENLGNDLPVNVYRMLEYAMHDTLLEEYGKDKMVDLFRKAGHKAGIAFATNTLDLTLGLDDFFEQLKNTLVDMKVGILRIEDFDTDSGKVLLTVSEDLDCSGLPVLGETVCNYDEGFIAGILQVYTKHPYVATEIDCWATGSRVCRFEAEVDNN